MKIFRELKIGRDSIQINHFINRVNNYVSGDWKYKHDEGYLFFDYTGNLLPQSQISIYINEQQKGFIRVGNIIPLQKSMLSVEEYNKILLKFYEDIILPFKNANPDVIIDEPSDDTFNPLQIISQSALEKLQLFTSAANKSTGSAHPNDRERWFSFICQTVDDDKMFDYDTLKSFLQDETFWGKDKAWNELFSEQLAEEYELCCEILLFYKRMHR